MADEQQRPGPIDAEEFTEEFSGDEGFDAEYHGRNYYCGPAVRIEASELQDTIRRINIPLLWDQLGKGGLIVYPKE